MPKQRQWVWMRSPRTQQERRANQDKNDPLIRARRRASRLPTEWDDIFLKRPKSWKYWRSRAKQHYTNRGACGWHELKWDLVGWCAYWSTMDRVKDAGCCIQRIPGGIRWYGPEL